jgi:hypothetical protein
LTEEIIGETLPRFPNERKGSQMGQQLVKLYEFARAAAGPTAPMRLAMKTMIPADKAASVPDSPDSIAKLRAAVREITGKEAPAA